MPDQARLVVLYAVSIEALKARKAATGVIRRARGRYALIRADAPVAFRMPVRPVLDVMPVQASPSMAINGGFHPFLSAV